MSKPKDLLTQKNYNSEVLAAQATHAIEMVTRTISCLQLVNQEIEDEMSEIEQYCHNLQAVSSKLDQNKKHNERIISNFNKLLSE